MRKLIALCFLIGSSAFANTNGYDLKMDLAINGKHISSPRVITKAGETASITQESNGQKIFVDVVATEQSKDNKQAILMNFAVGTISATGEKNVLFTPEVATLENEKAEIDLGDRQEPEKVSLSVIAVRKSL